MHHFLQAYQRRLINLSSNSRTLRLLRLSKSLHLCLHHLDFLLHKPSFEIIKNLLAQRPAPLCDAADASHAPTAKAARQLRLLQRQAQLIREERGAEALFLGWPFVHGKLPDGSLLRAPLLLFPVQLTEEQGKWVLKPQQHNPPHISKAFLLAYAQANNLQPDENLLSLDLSILPPDAQAFRVELYNLLKESSINLNFNSDLFTDKLISCNDYKKAELEQRWQNGQLQLMPEAVLGIFPEVSSYQLTDYEQLLKLPQLNTWEDLFEPAAAAGAAQLQEQQTFTVFLIDAAQETALQQVKQGQSLVVQGPPGTGKSQLICNLVSDFIARGKRVLVVSQKRAALDVVFQRLKSKELEPFTALVHDVNADRKELYTKLHRQIEQVESYRKANMALPGIYAERQFLEISRRINQVLETLRNFKSALFDDSVCGWAVKELYLKTSFSAPHIRLPELYSYFTAQTANSFEHKLQNLAVLSGKLDKTNPFWLERKSFAGQERQQLATVLKAVSEVINESLKALEVNHFTGTDRFVWLQKIAEKEPFWADLLETLQKPGISGLVRDIRLGNKPLTKLEKLLQTLYQEICKNEAQSIQVSEAVRGAIKQALDVYRQSENNLLKKATWLLSKKRKILQEALKSQQLSWNPEDISELESRLQQQEKLEKLTAEIQQIWPGFEYQFHPEKLKTALENALTAVALARQLKKLQQEKILLLEWPLISENELIAKVRQLVNTSKRLNREFTYWQQILTEKQLQQLASEPEISDKLLEELPHVFDVLVAFDELVDALPKPEKEMWQLLRENSSVQQEQLQLFRNSIGLAWIEHLERLQPVLVKASTGELELLEQELQKLYAEKQELSYRIVLANLREQTYKNLEQNRLGNVTTYRQLVAQVKKKRQLLPVRRLLTLHHETVFRLVPCWLASPESVSALFPLEKIFDLVIFDEASQCFAEAGLPALYRGKQTVVVGDAHQLSPTDLYRSRWRGDDASEEEEPLAESLLELAARFLPQAMLTEHYRSRFPELIGFSNHYFYHDKLNLVPEREAVQQKQPAIERIPVNGTWEKQMNRPEAERVVALLFELLRQGCHDIGIITFNYPQQQLVQDLAETKAANENIQLPESLQIKNIENMQGDEREIIILSTGYAPDANGKLRLNFGSLNTEGGQNRLNVAVTRAISKIFVVTGLSPELLHVEETKHLGPLRLKQFLTYAAQVQQGKLPVSYPVSPVFKGTDFLLKEQLLQQLNIKPGQAEFLKELPFADITVKQQENYLGVIRTDDDLFYSQVSVRQSHADWPQRLQRQRWPFITCYSRQFWLSPKQVIDEILNFYAEI